MFEQAFNCDYYDFDYYPKKAQIRLLSETLKLFISRT